VLGLVAREHRGLVALIERGREEPGNRHPAIIAIGGRAPAAGAR
jgi:hypothetical protein